MNNQNDNYYYSLDEDNIPTLDEYLKLQSTKIVGERNLSHDNAAEALLLIGSLLRESFANLDTYADKINDNLPLPLVFIKSGLQLLAASTEKDKANAIKELTDGLGLTADNRRRAISPVTAFDETETIKKTKVLSQDKAFKAVASKLGVSKSTVSKSYYEHKTNVNTYYSKLCHEFNLPPDDTLRESFKLGRYKPIEDPYFKISECIRRCLYPEQANGFINIEKDHLFFTKIYDVMSKNLEFRTFEGLQQATYCYSRGEETYQDHSVQKYFKYHNELHHSLSIYIDKVVDKIKSTNDDDIIFARSIEKLEEHAEKKYVYK